MNSGNGRGDARAPGWDHSTHQEFLDYYTEKSASPEELRRFRSVRDLVLRFVNPAIRPLDVADIGCGAGAQSLVWAEIGHRVHALDISAELLELGRQRAHQAALEVDFRVGSATQIPWPARSMDVCLVLGLLEHVRDWSACLDEFTRILRPGGRLLLNTTNALCPIQHEYTLPLYSWYPGPLKRHYERLAATTRPEIAAHATYPAVNWFTFYSLREALQRRGLRSLDRFDIMDLRTKGRIASVMVSAIRHFPPLRWLAHVATPSTLVLAVKDRSKR